MGGVNLIHHNIYMSEMSKQNPLELSIYTLKNKGQECKQVFSRDTSGRERA
jgi:hypothetical protein